MSDDNKSLKVTFAPGVLEQLEQDMDPNDLQELLDALKQGFEDGSLLNESTLVDMEELKNSDFETYQKLVELVEIQDFPTETPTIH